MPGPEMIFGTRDSEGNILEEHEYAVRVHSEEDWTVRKCGGTCGTVTKQTVLSLFSVNAGNAVAGTRTIYVCTQCGGFRVAPN